MVTTTQPPLNALEVCKLLRISRPTLRAWIREGRFPKPLDIGFTRQRRWSAAAIEELLASGLNQNGEKKPAKARRQT
jgi:excisionase family DNA binding protein